MRNPCKSLFILSFLCFSCGSSPIHYERTTEVFSTACFFHAYEEKKEILSELIDLANKHSKALDRYDECSDLYVLNHSHEFIEVDPILLDCLSLCKVYEEDSLLKNAFSITLGDIKDLYEESYANHCLPDQDALEDKLEKAHQTSFEIEGNLVRRIGEGSFDLGGVAKGYYLLKAQEILKAKGVTKYQINLGKSSVLLGDSGVGDGIFNVSIKNHDNVRFKLKNAAISTSSIQEQSYKIDGVTYSHIFNPNNGSAISNYDVVTLVGDDPCYLDACSTAFMHMDIESIRSSNIQCVVIKDAKVVYSNGLI